jgi:hypothetical protein
MRRRQFCVLYRIFSFDVCSFNYRNVNKLLTFFAATPFHNVDVDDFSSV